MRRYAACLLFIAVLMFTGCGKEVDTKDSDKLNIVTSLYAPYDYVRQIAGDNVNVTMLLAPGEESHSYEPTPKDIIGIKNCDLFIYNGGENEEWVSRILSDNKDINAIRMMDVVSQVYEEEIKEGMEAEENDEAEYDEHVWTSLDNAASIVNAIKDELVKLDSEHAKEYQANAGAYTDSLNTLKNEIQTVVDTAARKTIVLGDRFPMRYFVEEFGLDYYAAFPGCSADTEANAATIKYLSDTVKKENIPVIFMMELSSGNIAKTIADETNVKTSVLYACHNISAEDYKNGIGYIDLMRRNLEALKEALN